MPTKLIVRLLDVLSLIETDILLIAAPVDTLAVIVLSILIILESSPVELIARTSTLGLEETRKLNFLYVLCVRFTKNTIKNIAIKY